MALSLKEELESLKRILTDGKRSKGKKDDLMIYVDDAIVKLNDIMHDLKRGKLK